MARALRRSRPRGLLARLALALSLLSVGARAAGTCADGRGGRAACAELRPRAPLLRETARLDGAPRLYALADEWDPVQRSSVAARGLVGTQCLFASPEPAACAACYARPPPYNLTEPACLSCFAQRHIYAHYVYTDVPGPRAVCRPLAARQAGKAAEPSQPSGAAQLVVSWS